MDRPPTPAERPDLYERFWGYFPPNLGTRGRTGWRSLKLLLPSILAAADDAALEALVAPKRGSAPPCWPATLDELRIVRYCLERVRAIWRAIDHDSAEAEVARTFEDAGEDPQSLDYAAAVGFIESIDYLLSLRQAIAQDAVLGAVASRLTVAAPHLEPSVVEIPVLERNAEASQPRGGFEWQLGSHKVLWELAAALGILQRRCLSPNCPERIAFLPSRRWDVVLREPYCETHAKTRDRALEARVRRRSVSNRARSSSGRASIEAFQPVRPEF